MPLAEKTTTAESPRWVRLVTAGVLSALTRAVAEWLLALVRD
ncbi:hypothetical protein [Embleya sp. NPDC005575]